MNKYEEAFNTLVNGFCCECRWTLGDKDCERYACFKKVNTLQELVEKTTPKKVRRALYIANGYKHYCPICSSYVGTISKVGRIDEDDYCPTCGQALDWSGEDE